MSETMVQEENSEHTRASQDVGRAARQGGVWSVVTYAFSKVSGFASSIVLARLLMPEDFGLVGMVGTVMATVQMLGFWGVGVAVMNNREKSDEYANTGWWLEVMAGIALFAIANAAAPLAILYYHEPRLRMIVFVASINYLINPLGDMMEIIMLRDFHFKRSAGINLASGFLVSLLSITFAFLGAGVYSFIYPHIVAGALTVILRWRLSGFRPRRPVGWSHTGKILGFGKHLFGANLIDYINQNADYVLVGGLIGEKALGLYLFAFNLGTWIVQNITKAIASVLFPTITSLQKDHARASELFLRLIQVISIVGFPLVTIQWAVAPLYVCSIYGDKWHPCITAFRLIAVYGMGRAVCQPALNLISAMGRPDVNLKVSAATCPILVTAIYIGSRSGINGVALATALAHGFFVWFYVIIPFRILGWDVKRFFTALKPAFVSSMIAAVITGLVYRALGRPTVALGYLALLAALGAAVYCGTMLLLFRKTAVGTWRLMGTALKEARE